MQDTAAHRPKAAVFHDAENHADLCPSSVMSYLDPYDVVERHAYADWRNPCLSSLAERLREADFDMHHASSGRHPGAWKNTADGYMAVGIRRVLDRRSEITVIVIISGDEYFADIARELRQLGKEVIVASDPRRTSKALLRVASRYLPLGDWAHCIWTLHRLEETSDYVTFRYAVQRRALVPSDLAQLIRQGLVIQEVVNRPQRGVRREIRLNRRAHPVRAVLDSCSFWPSAVS
jgi:signal recognition particle subunit SEC65